MCHVMIASQDHKVRKDPGNSRTPLWGGAGRGGPETQCAVVAVLDAAHLSTMVDFKLQEWDWEVKVTWSSTGQR